MNNLEAEHLPISTDIYWICERDTVQIVRNGELTNLEFGGVYGIYKFEVHQNNALADSFIKFNNNRRRSFDWKFEYVDGEFVLFVDGVRLDRN